MYNNYLKAFNLIVISSPHTPHSDGELDAEIAIVYQMFEEGLSTFHLRKPKMSRKRMKQYLNLIPKKYLNRVIIHSYHFLSIKYRLKGVHLKRKHRKKKFRTWLKLAWLKLNNPNLYITTSFQSLSSFYDTQRSYNYVFLSPVFDSISKKGYMGAFKAKNLSIELEHLNQNVYALGGIDENTVDKAREYGFKGAALLGAIWNSKNDKLEIFKRVRNKCLNTTSPNKKIKITPVKMTLNY